METLDWTRVDSRGLTWTLAAGNIGSLVGTNISLAKEAPRSSTGYGNSLGFICLGLLTATVLEVCPKAGNKTKEQQRAEHEAIQYSDEQLDKMVDKSPFFRYMR